MLLFVFFTFKISFVKKNCLVNLNIYTTMRNCMLFHCMKSVQIRSFCWSVFSIFLYSDWIQENTDQKLDTWTLFTQCFTLMIFFLEERNIIILLWWQSLTTFLLVMLKKIMVLPSFAWYRIVLITLHVIQTSNIWHGNRFLSKHVIRQ